MQTQNKRTILQRIIIGVKKGYLTPSLPEHILVLNSNIFIRIFRVAGGLTTLFLITHRLEILGNGLLYITSLYICFIITFLLAIYSLFIAYHRVRHIHKLIKTGKLDVYNSPFDRFASHLARTIACSKGVCDSVAPVGFVFGSLAAIDTLREAKGLEPIFIPFIASIFIPDSEATRIYKEKRALTAQMIQNKTSISYLDEEHSIINKLLHHNVIDETDASDWRNQVNINKGFLMDQNREMKSKLLEGLTQYNNSKK
uniref:hypothetical protein n=1 Tax=Pappia fissilis TaxID=1040649 RepID=UPI002A83FF98|nr:hypothetical protein UYP79_mgp047 [Pappia fissilis]WOX61289.1 hypothetical protein [Pappia fissilis]